MYYLKIIFFILLISSCVTKDNFTSEIPRKLLKASDPADITQHQLACLSKPDEIDRRDGRIVGNLFIMADVIPESSDQSVMTDWISSRILSAIQPYERGEVKIGYLGFSEIHRSKSCVSARGYINYYVIKKHTIPILLSWTSLREKRFFGRVVIVKRTW